MHLPALRIATRLRASFAVVVALLLALGAVALWGVGSLGSDARSIVSGLDPLARQTLTVKYLSADLNRDFLAIPAKGGDRESVEDFSSVEDELRAALAELGRRADTPHDRQAVAEIEATFAAFLDVVHRDEALLRQGRRDAAMELALTDGDEAFDAFD